jgi:hypothetical protein
MAGALFGRARDAPRRQVNDWNEAHVGHLRHYAKAD